MFVWIALILFMGVSSPPPPGACDGSCLASRCSRTRAHARSADARRGTQVTLARVAGAVMFLLSGRAARTRHVAGRRAPPAGQRAASVLSLCALRGSCHARGMLLASRPVRACVCVVCASECARARHHHHVQEADGATARQSASKPCFSGWAIPATNAASAHSAPVPPHPIAFHPPLPPTSLPPIPLPLPSPTRTTTIPEPGHTHYRATYRLLYR